MVADRRRDSGVVDRDDMTNDEPNSNEQNTHDGIYDFDGHRKKSLSDLRVNQPSVKLFGPWGKSPVARSASCRDQGIGKCGLEIDE
jgi:hypothetical protein